MTNDGRWPSLPRSAVGDFTANEGSDGGLGERFRVSSTTVQVRPAWWRRNGAERLRPWPRVAGRHMPQVLALVGEENRPMPAGVAGPCPEPDGYPIRQSALAEMLGAGARDVPRGLGPPTPCAMEALRAFGRREPHSARIGGAIDKPCGTLETFTRARRRASRPR